MLCQKVPLMRDSLQDDVERLGISFSNVLSLLVSLSPSVSESEHEPQKVVASVLRLFCSAVGYSGSGELYEYGFGSTARLVFAWRLADFCTRSQAMVLAFLYRAQTRAFRVGAFLCIGRRSRVSVALGGTRAFSVDP